ncbi:MAG TPA: cytochrome c biogenesis protein CcdA [Vicinamibacterales bacterium]|nr:cytochrome c biogenesis protein CcdA [Vicinamibacterales bacterium]
MRHRAPWVIGFLWIAAAIAGAQAAPPVPVVTPIVETSGVHAGQPLRAALRVRLPPGSHVQSNKPRDESLIPTVLTITPPAGVTVVEIVFPPATDLKQAGQSQPLAVFDQNFDIGVRFAIAAGAHPGEITVPARLRYQACDENLCYIPSTLPISWTFRVVPSSTKVVATDADVFGRIRFGQGDRPGEPSKTTAPRTDGEQGEGGRGAHLDDFTVLQTTGGYLSATDFLDFIHRAETGARQQGLFEGRGPFAILSIVFLGGLALNLTPCVLPMIPINLSIIGAGARAGSRGRGFLLGGTYGAAMALAYGVLGLVVILTAGAFGTINASPWFNLAISVLFVILALAMFDIITIDFSGLGGNSQVAEQRRGTFVLAFTMGGVAALLAGACVAPVVIQVMLFSSDLYAKGTPAALALPFVLGLGMAVPWPLAGAGLASLPKPGMWMVRVKQAFAVLILVMAAYYGYEAYSLFANRWVNASDVQASVDEQLRAGWHSSLDEGLLRARRDRKPVLIDMWATWCKNCLTMDKTTLVDRQVTSALEKYVKIKFQAEDPDAPAVKLVMQRFKAVGLPTYVILKPTE